MTMHHAWMAAAVALGGTLACLDLTAAGSILRSDRPLDMAPARQAPPPTEIYLASFTESARRTAGNGYIGIQKEGVEVGQPINITSNPGYDNQPYFLADSSGLLFSSNRDGKQTDIYRYDIASTAVTQVTRTPENEYSPTITPDGRTFSTVRGAEQRIWRFNLDGSDAGMVWGDRGLIGYHAWLSPQQLAAFVLGADGKPNALQLLDLQTHASEILESRIGRSLHIRPGRGTLTFVHKPEGGSWVIKELDPKSRKIETLTSTLAGSEDFAWTPGGLIVMGAKSRLHFWKASEDRWFELADLGARGLAAITRLAVSPDGKWIAIVSTPSLRATSVYPSSSR